MTTAVSPPGIEALITTDAHGVARVVGSRVKVAHLALEHTHAGLTPEQVVAAYPQLSVTQVEAALSYYYAHRAAVDRQIAEAAAFADQERAAAEESPFAARMRAEGRLPTQGQAA